MNLIYLIIGLVLLVAGGDFLVKGAVALSIKLNVSRWIIGLSVVSFATSAPELIVSVNAALDGYPDIALGNVVGSNIANIALVLSLILAVYGISIHWKAVKVDFIFLVLASLLLPAAFLLGFGLTFYIGLLFVCLLAMYLWIQIRTARRTTQPALDKELEKSGNLKPAVTILFLLLGGGLLYGGSELLITGAIGLAEALNISERIISLTMVSVGTSIPELAASIMAARKKEADLAISNLIGSNIFNIFSVLGITVMVKPILQVDSGLIQVDFWVMLSAVLGLGLWIIGSQRKWFNHLLGATLLLAYITYVVLIF